MKKAALILLAALMALGCLAGCGGGNSSAPASPAPASQAPAAPAEPAAPAAGGTVADGSYDVEMDMMGDKVPVHVEVAGGKYTATYKFSGNPITITGDVAAEWTIGNIDGGLPQNFAGDVVRQIQEGVVAAQ